MNVGRLDGKDDQTLEEVPHRRKTVVKLCSTSRAELTSEYEYMSNGTLAFFAITLGALSVALFGVLVFSF